MFEGGKHLHAMKKRLSAYLPVFNVLGLIDTICHTNILVVTSIGTFLLLSNVLTIRVEFYVQNNKINEIINLLRSWKFQSMVLMRALYRRIRFLCIFLMIIVIY